MKTQINGLHISIHFWVRKKMYTPVSIHNSTSVEIFTPAQV